MILEKLAAKFAGNKIGDTISKVMDSADGLFTSKEEKMKLQNEMQAEVNRAIEAERADVLETLKAELADIQNARKSNIDVVTNENVPFIIKIRATLIAFFITLVWGAMTVYVLGTLLNIIKRDANVNFEAVLGLYALISSKLDTVINFDFGSSVGSHNKQKQLDKMANK